MTYRRIWCFWRWKCKIQTKKWALRTGSQGWHKFPKQPASVGTWGRGLVGILWVSLQRKMGYQITNKRVPRRVFWHWKENPSSFETQMSWCEVLVPNTHPYHCPWIKSSDVWVWTRTDAFFLFFMVFVFLYHRADQSSRNLSLNFLHVWTQLSCKHITSLKLV